MRTSRFRHATAAALLLGAGLAGACSALTVDTHMARGAELTRYRTFAWGAPDSFSTGDPRLDHNEFFDRHLRAQVERGLAGKGYEKTASGTPDLLVHYHVNVVQEIDARDLDPDYEDCARGDCQPSVHDVGTLFVDLVDPRSKQLVWRGWAEGSIEGLIDNQDWLEARVNESVARILARLPRRL